MKLFFAGGRLARVAFGAAVLCATSTFASPRPAHAWGLTGHRLLTDRAVRLLPTKMQDFYWMNRPSLEKWCVEPDFRKDTDKLEGPKHYIDLERYPPNPPVLLGAARKRFDMKQLRWGGWAPWHAQAVFSDLVRAFRDEDYAAILRWSGELSHYISDMHVPLHTTENFDGWLTGDTGVHARFEGRLIDQFPESVPFEPVPAEFISDVPARIWAIVRASYSTAQLVIDMDRKNAYPDRARDGYSVVKSRATFGPLAARRLNDSTSAVASLWYTAWVTADRPALPAREIGADEHGGGY